MTRPELDEVVSWAAAEGWNPGLQDAGCFYAADPTGFLIGILDDQPMAAISAVKYGTSFGFIGFYIVKPEFRGQGYGWKIWQAGMAALADRNVGLDGVIAQQANYLKSGFELAYRNIRYEGHAAEQTTEIASPEGLTPLASLSFETVCDYDRRFFPTAREQFLRCWLSRPGHIGWAKVSDSELLGYGVLRPCQSGYKIGPLFAETAESAEEIFLGLRSHLVPQTPLYLDTPEANPAAVALAEKYNMHRVFETARMYTTSSPDLPLNKIFGVTTFELG